MCVEYAYFLIFIPYFIQNMRYYIITIIINSFFENHVTLKKHSQIYFHFFLRIEVANEIYLSDLSIEMAEEQQQNSLDDDNNEGDLIEMLGMDAKGNMRFRRGVSITGEDGEAESFDLDKEIRENLLGIFVVAFDTRQGNLVEWQMPESLNLDQIEFKAMASGFHLVQKDFVYVANLYIFFYLNT
jgi:hypothetical protein